MERGGNRAEGEERRDRAANDRPYMAITDRRYDMKGEYNKWQNST